MRVLVAGLGNMGMSHALAHARTRGVTVAGLVNRSPVALPPELTDVPLFKDFREGLDAVRPDLAVIATYTDSHADYAVAAMEAGAHVFVEKPLAATVADARRMVAAAQRLKRKLVVGYILRHHPSWQRLIAEARALGGPYVFRLNLNQQSTGPTWETHKNLMRTTSPIVDCGVHYVDVMCQITDARPIRVQGMGLRLSDEIPQSMYNYGQFQVFFQDGSIGWYEAGWGPMMSETAYFVKDVISPRGAVSIVADEGPGSDSVEGHTRVGRLRIHPSGGKDRHVAFDSEPGHQELCNAEQAHVRRAIEEDLDLARHMQDALASLEVCLAADESIRLGHPVELEDEE